MWTNEIKTKAKPLHVTFHWLHVLLLALVHRYYYGIMKGIDTTMSSASGEPKKRFIVNNILMVGSAWCLVMAQIQLSLIKKIRIERPEHSLKPTSHPHPLTLLSPILPRLFIIPHSFPNWVSYVYHPWIKSNFSRLFR